MDRPNLNIERHTRRTTGEMLRKERVISRMIDRIKALFQDVNPIELGPESAEDDLETLPYLDDSDEEDGGPE